MVMYNHIQTFISCICCIVFLDNRPDVPKHVDMKHILVVTLYYFVYILYHFICILIVMYFYCYVFFIIM
jgi:hypothetical protein